MNIVFIVIDTLRAKRLGCYGYAKPTSPAMDRLAREGARFANCFAPGIPTTPAHATMFTGMHPLSHNIVCHGGQVDLDRRIPVLAELLQQGGYTTAAVDNLYDIKPWLARGYEFYINPSFRHKLRILVSCEEINARASEWLKAHSREKFFLFLHYWEPHTPYMPPKRYQTFYPADRDPYAPDNHSFEPVKSQPIYGMFGDLWFQKLGPVTDADYVSSLYDAEIRHADDGIAQLLATLDETGLADDTLVVLTGDHGESLTEHDIYFDHHGLYDETIHVPLLMRLPGKIAPDTVPLPLVQHLDIAPTLLDACGIAAPANMEGKSLWPLATAQTDQGGWETVYCCESTWQSKWAVRTQDAKFILARQPDRHHMPMREFYDLTKDPAERHNLADERPDETAAMETDLETWIASGLARTGRMEDPLITQGLSLGKRWDDWVKK
jgi:arylsulfatase